MAPVPNPQTTATPGLTAEDVSRVARETHLSEQAVRDVSEALVRRPGVNPLDTLRPRAKETLTMLCRKGSFAYREAKDRKMTFSDYLEELDPDGGRYADGLDAFQRLMAVCGIRTHTVKGRMVYADTVRRLYEGGEGISSARELLGEEVGNRFYASDAPSSIVLFPEFINRQIRVVGQILPSILEDLTAISTGIDSAVYDSFYLNLDTTQLSLERIGEGADIPTAELTGSGHTIRLKKYARALKGTYEVFRRMSLDRFAFHLQQMAIQTAVDKSQRALDVLINGDGNPNTPATVFNLSTLQAGGAGAPLTVGGWLAFSLKFKDPYKITTALMQDANAISLLALNMGSFNLPFAQFRQLQQGLGGGFQVGEPINMDQPMRIYSRAFAPANQIVALDNQRALEMVTEMGADLVETDKLIQQQLNTIVISEVVDFAVLDPQACKILDLSA